MDSCFGVVVPPSRVCSIVGTGIPYAVLCAVCSSSSSVSEVTPASSESSEGSGSSLSLFKSGDSMYGVSHVPTVRVAHFRHLTKREIYSFNYSLKTPPNHLKPRAFGSRLEVD